VIQEVNDGMLNQNGLPDGEPLLKASYADNNPALDSCYEGWCAPGGLTFLTVFNSKKWPNQCGSLL
jgi:hypothetical protein